MATRSIRCSIVSAPSENCASRQYDEIGSDLLPWADPYIAQLMQSLHDAAPEPAVPDCPSSDSWQGDGCQLEARPPFDARYFSADRFRRFGRWS